MAQALDELASAAAKVTDPQALWIPIDTAAFAAFAEGRLAEAGHAWRGGARRYRTRAHDLFYWAAMTALLMGDGATAGRDLAELEALSMRAPLMAARMTVLRAGMAALEGDVNGALGKFGAAIRQFRSLGTPFEEASAELAMATVLDPAAPEVRAAADAATEILTRLGAQPFLDRLQARMGSAGRLSPAHRHEADTEALAPDLATSA